MSDLRRVYQGGHHDVWCDGEVHMKCEGGYTHPDRSAPSENARRSKCDCAKWANGKHGWDA